MLPPQNDKKAGKIDKITMKNGNFWSAGKVEQQRTQNEAATSAVGYLLCDKPLLFLRDLRFYFFPLALTHAAVFSRTRQTRKTSMSPYMSATESEEIVTPRINTVFNKFYGYNLAFGPFYSQFLNESKIQIV